MHGNLRSGDGLRLRCVRGPGVRILAALDALGENAGTLLRHDERPWASITFSGSHHRAVFMFAGNDEVAAGERFVAELPEHEFAIPGQLVAEAAVRSVEHVLLPDPRLTVEVELLLLEES